MYVINLAGDWGKALFKFSESLVNKLGDNLVMIIGLENEDELVYDSNVLVVVRSKDDETVREIARTALEVNAKYKCSINFHVVEENEQG
ncbi:hypothetical protein [Sulfolobus acidocaldarius]|uniref:hypothetical protein n=1 Tax=Sulfolobus acidocaldarius TaxID=2285 RepID=UPI001E32684A|nr:hypothetical protein [Sulfolobus acidocaldarius]